MFTLDYASPKKKNRGLTTLNLLACLTGATVLAVPAVVFLTAFATKSILANPSLSADLGPVVRTVMVGYSPLLWGLSLLGVSLSTASLAASRHVNILACSGLFLSLAALISQGLMLLA